MKLVDFLDAQNLTLELRRHSNERRWSTVISGLRIKDANTYTSVNGQGQTIEESIVDFADNIQGQYVCMGYDGDKDYREFVIPKPLEY